MQVAFIAVWRAFWLFATWPVQFAESLMFGKCARSHEHGMGKRTASLFVCALAGLVEYEIIVRAHSWSWAEIYLFLLLYVVLAICAIVAYIELARG